MQIKKEFEAAYKEYVERNKDEYGSEVVRVGEIVMCGLDAGLSPEAAMDAGVKGSGITGFMAGCLAQAVSHFHERGEEFRAWWNDQYGVKSDKGVVNPAILNIESKEE